ncbi:protein artichoke-like [Nylanderia fulva]|uniref:protein artichoke-like n=1 Tax=Nylanderia fulva TaxID=613905 RepID=UPI0010FB61F8|nr:protein artichoke-like [Nylanderia fulva]
MKFVILLLLLMTFVVQSYQQEIYYKNTIRTVSIDFSQHDRNYNFNFLKNEKKKCGNIERLNLDDMNLQLLKNDIITSNNIQHISLRNNDLKNIHTILDQVPNLSCLNLSRNKFDIYNRNYIRHPNLKTLDLSYQKTSQNLYYYTSSEAKDLEAETNEIYKYIIFDSTGMSLPNLQYLDLSGNEISALLNDFKTSFPKLVQLDLNNIKAQEIEPTFFEKIPKSLRVIHMENNHLHNLTMLNMAEVSALYLDGNRYLRVINVASEKLKILSLSNCTNLVQGHGIFNIPYLEQLDLSNNDFTTVSTISFKVFPVLKILLLDYNKLTDIPLLNDLQQLSELSLSFNLIRYIRSDIFMYFTSLKKLSLRGNKIQDIGQGFSDLNNLEYLDLSNNQLKTLPHNWATRLINLQYLNVNSNLFVNVVDVAINSIASLKHLSVVNNTFTKISSLELLHLPESITVYMA